MITLSSTKSGVFIAAFVDPNTRSKKLERIENDSEIENLYQLFNSITQGKSQTNDGRQERLCQKIKQLNPEQIKVALH
jgi:tryptophan synthase alpha subunit